MFVIFFYSFHVISLISLVLFSYELLIFDSEILLLSLFLLFIHFFSRSFVLSLVSHRYFSHRAFKFRYQVYEGFFAFLTCFSFYPYGLVTWSNRHHYYHEYTHCHIKHRQQTNRIQHKPSNEFNSFNKNNINKKPLNSETALDCTECKNNIEWSDIQNFWLNENLIVESKLWTITSKPSDIYPDNNIGEFKNQHSILILLINKHHRYLCLLFFVFQFLFPSLLISNLSYSFWLIYCFSLILSQVLSWHISAFIMNPSFTQLLHGYQIFDSRHVGINVFNNSFIALMSCGEYSHTHCIVPEHPNTSKLFYEIDISYLAIKFLSQVGIVTLTSSTLSTLDNCRDKYELTFPSTYIYKGHVSHTRMWPFYHRFTYDVMYMYIELNDWTNLMLDSRLLYTSRIQPAWGTIYLASFRSSDYLDRSEVYELMKKEIPDYEYLPDKLPQSFKVFLLTNWRYFGFTFNPISYYYCFLSKHLLGNDSVEERNDKENELAGEMICMISEVHNTPWNEKCWYVHKVTSVKQEIIKQTLPEKEKETEGKSGLNSEKNKNGNRIISIAGGKNYHQNRNSSDPYCDLMKVKSGIGIPFYDYKQKKMHVSPFMAMNYIYSVHYSLPSAKLLVRWQMHHNQSSSNKDKFIPQKTYSLFSPHPIFPQSSIKQIGSSSSCSSQSSDHTYPSHQLTDKHFKAFLELTREESSQLNLILVLVNYPFMTAKVVLLIYWQAAILFLKRRATFFSHPIEKAEEEKVRLPYLI